MKIMRWNAFALALALSLCMAAGLAGATVAPAGDPDYISMHNYLTKTDIPDVYKVTLSMQCPPVAAEVVRPVYVCIVLFREPVLNLDVYDSSGQYTGTGLPGYITNNMAMDVALRSAIRALVDDGNKDIYIYLVHHASSGTPTHMPAALNAIAEPSGFVSLYDGGRLRPEFDANDPAWIMKDWGSFVNPGGWSGWASGYNGPFSYIYSIMPSAWVNGYLPLYAAPYVITVGNERDAGATILSQSSLAYATAMKAPRDVNFAPGGSTFAQDWILNVNGGLGATIWSVGITRNVTHDPNWESAVLSAPASSWPPIDSGETPENRMIAMTMKFPESFYATLPALAPADDSYTIFDNYLRPYYLSQGITSLTYGRNANYIYSRYLYDPDPAVLTPQGKPLTNFFYDFADAAANASRSVHGQLNGHMVLNPAFELYAYPGEPLLKTTANDPSTVQSANSQGRRIDWNMTELKSEDYVTLSFYVKLDRGGDPELYYPVFDQATMQYIPNGQTAMVTKKFPIPYVRLDGETKDGTHAGGNGTGSAGMPTSTDKSGADGHQENREMAGGTASGWGGGLDVPPQITGLAADKDASGRSRVSVELKNGSAMRYQWQFKNDAGEWEDIFGANGSHYSLGRQFAVNQTYELRCKITNPAGKITYTEGIETQRGAEESGGLQSKDGGAAIESESLMDAGEEIIMANTAAQGLIFYVLAALVLLAAAVFTVRAVLRRR